MQIVSRAHAAFAAGVLILLGCGGFPTAGGPTEAGSLQEDGSPAQDGALQDDGATELARSVCETCVDGGETSDFPGDGYVCCSYAATPVSAGDARARTLGSEQYLSWMAGHFELPFRWWRGWGGTRVSGYEPETVIELDVRVAELSYLTAAPITPIESYCANVVCEDTLKFDVEVELATQDGAIHGVSEHAVLAPAGAQALTTRSGYQEVQQYGEAWPPMPPLSAFDGTLDFALDVERAHSGSLDVRATFTEAGVHGTLAPRLHYHDRTPRDLLPYALPLVSAPVGGSWPVPSCGGLALPIAGDATLATGATLGEHFADFRDQVASAFPVAASWLDGSQTELLLELEGEFELACDARNNPATYSLVVRLHVATADGKLDAVVPARLILQLLEGGPAWRFDLQSEAMEVPEFSALTGIDSAGFDGDSEAMFALEGDLDHGDLQAWGYSDQRHTREYLFWCLRDDCSSYPQPFFTSDEPPR